MNTIYQFKKQISCFSVCNIGLHQYESNKTLEKRIKFNLLKLILIFIMIISLPIQTIAQDDPANNKYWVGGAEGNFDNPNNWDPVGIPVSTDDIFINSGGSGYIVHLNIDFELLSIGRIFISSQGDKLIIEDGVTLENWYGSINIGRGILENNGTLINRPNGEWLGLSIGNLGRFVNNDTFLNQGGKIKLYNLAVIDNNGYFILNVTSDVQIINQTNFNNNSTGLLSNHGKISITWNGVLTNDGIIINHEAAEINTAPGVGNDRAFLNNTSTGKIDNYGLIENHAILENQNLINNFETGTIENSWNTSDDDKSIIKNREGNIVNEGNIINSGKIILAWDGDAGTRNWGDAKNWNTDHVPNWTNNSNDIYVEHVDGSPIDIFMNINVDINKEGRIFVQPGNKLTLDTNKILWIRAGGALFVTGNFTSRGTILLERTTSTTVKSGIISNYFFGTVILDGYVNNYGEILNLDKNAKFYLNGIINNYNLILNDEGLMDNNGTLENHDWAYIENRSKYNSATFRNFGTINNKNYGWIKNYGYYTDYPSIIENYDWINNYGLLENGHTSVVAGDKRIGVIVNKRWSPHYWGHIMNYNSIKNEIGSITNEGTFSIETNATFSQTPGGIFTNTTTGAFLYAGEVANNGAFNNDCEGLINELEGGTFTGNEIIDICEPVYNTLEGENFSITLIHTPITATLLFENVTQSGNTYLTSTNSGPDIPAGFYFGDPENYFNIETTAQFSGNIHIEVDYSEIYYEYEESLGLFHYVNNAWTEITTNLDVNSNLISGSVSTLSEFVILQKDIFVSIPDPNFEQALIDQGIDSDGQINQQILKSDAEAVTGQLYVTEKNISDLTGIEAFTNLTGLFCYKNQLTQIDISQNTSLTAFSCYSNQLTTLDVSNNTALTSLVCSDNQLLNLDVSNNSLLEVLTISRNGLSTLDLSFNTRLKRLYCETNQISTLDLTNNPDLEELFCLQNNLSSINLNHNPKLNWLVISNNSLTELDLTQNPLLEGLFCSGNQLTSIGFPYNSLLYRVNVSRNQLTALYFNPYPALELLLCNNNLLTFLDVRNGNNQAITTFSAANNNLNCVNVDDEIADHSGWSVDVGVIFSNDCNNNTQPGDNVTVALTGDFETTVQYDNVTQSGNTTMENGLAGPEIPSGYSFGQPATYFDIETTASFSGSIEIVIYYGDMAFINEDALRILHYEIDQWVDITTSVDFLNKKIYGETSSLSPFVIVQDNVSPDVKCKDATVYLDSNGNASITSADIDNGSFDISGIESLELDKTTFTCDDIGENPVTLTVSDIYSNVASCSAVVTVVNDDPIINSISLPTDPVDISQQVQAYANFEGNNLVSSIWNWGDGSVTDSEGAIIGNIISGVHTYSNAGVYEVVLTITDVCGTSSTESYKYLVIYDPKGGFVTGGGWIESPLGAYYQDPLLTGRANFGFVSKYKKGQMVPDGNTEFQFQTADLNFKSTYYDWLIVAGTKAIFKGSGNINGIGTFNFILSAKDEDKEGGNDTFRIKIWEAFSEVVVYDNQLGADDNSDPTTAIRGGSIIVHQVKGNARVSNSKEIFEVSIENDSSEISYWPNPTEDFFNIRLNSEGVKNIEIHVFDTNGRMVHFKRDLKSGIYSFGEDLSSGIYFTHLYLDGQKRTIRLIKY